MNSSCLMVPQSRSLPFPAARWRRWRFLSRPFPSNRPPTGAAAERSVTFGSRPDAHAHSTEKVTTTGRALGAHESRESVRQCVAQVRAICCCVLLRLIVATSEVTAVSEVTSSQQRSSGPPPKTDRSRGRGRRANSARPNERRTHQAESRQQQTSSLAVAAQIQDSNRPEEVRTAAAAKSSR